MLFKDHLKDLVMPVTGGNMAQSISWIREGSPQGQGMGASQQVCWRVWWLWPQHQGAGFLHPGPQTAAADHPGIEKPPKLDGGEQITALLPNLSNFSSPLEEQHCLFLTQSLSPLPNSPTPASVLQRLHSLTKFLCTTTYKHLVSSPKS